jgi:transcription elongation factor Elf1
MTLKHCSGCGKQLIKISSKSSEYKAVCTSCELTYKLFDTEGSDSLVRIRTASPSQLTEAAIR